MPSGGKRRPEYRFWLSLTAANWRVSEVKRGLGVHSDGVCTWPREDSGERKKGLKVRPLSNWVRPHVPYVSFVVPVDESRDFFSEYVQ